MSRNPGRSGPAARPGRLVALSPRHDITFMTAFSDRVQAALAPGYTIQRELTGGGMSHVFLATERALGRSVVVKVLPAEPAAGLHRDRFRREIHLAAQLQDPHLVPLLTAGEDGHLLDYTMPYVS